MGNMEFQAFFHIPKDTRKERLGSIFLLPEPLFRIFIIAENGLFFKT